MDNKTSLSLAEYFYRTVDNYADMPALRCCGEDRSYKELHARAQSIAAWLRTHFPKGAGIGILMSRSFEMYASIWGVICAGMYYVPMDTGYPPQRVAAIIEDSGVCAVLCDDEGKTLCSDDELGVVSSIIPQTEDAVRIIDADASNSRSAVFYTSGSTGRPKGIVTSQRALSNQIARFSEFLGVNSECVFLFKTPIAFHAAIFEYLMCALAGGCGVITESGCERDAAALTNQVIREKANVLFVVPSMLHSMAAYCRHAGLRLDELRIVWTAGEPLLQATVDLAEECTNASLYHALGGSEYAGIVAAQRCKGGSTDAIVPVGRMLDGIFSLLLNENGVPSDTGRLCVDISVTGSRYLDERLNEGRFIEYEASDGRIHTLFRSDDIMCRNGSTLSFLNRSDDVIKLRGMRIDLNEVENALKQVRSLDDSAVALENGKLIAYIVPSDDANSEKLAVQQAANELKNKLAEYMIPSVWRIIDELPRLTSGKRDRAGLAHTQWRQVTLSCGGKKPVTPVQKEITALWEELLGVSDIGMEDNFFELGGISLEVTRMMSILNERFGAEISLARFAAEPTVSALEKMLFGNEMNTPTQRAVPAAADTEKIYEPFPLTPLQQAYYIGRQDGMQFGSIPSHTYFEVTLKQYDLERVRTVVQTIVDNESALRIEVLANGTQRIVPGVKVNVSERLGGALNDTADTLSAVRRELNSRRFDLAKAPLLEVVCVPNGNGGGTAAFLTDNIVADGISCIRFAWLFIENYAGDAGCDHSAYSIRDYAVYYERLRESEAYVKDMEYKLRMAEGYPEPIKLPKGDGAAGEPRMHTVRISEDLYGSICSIAAENGISPFVMMLTAVIETLSAQTYEKRFLIGVPFENRPLSAPGFGKMIGAFSDFMLFACESEMGESFISAAKKYEKQIWENREHAAFTAVELMREMNARDGGAAIGRIPLVFTSLLDVCDTDNENAFLSHFQSHTSQVTLEMVLLRINDGICVNFTYSENEIAEKFVLDTGSMLLDLLGMIADDQDCVNKHTVPPLPEKDALIIAKANETASPLSGQSVRSLLLQSFKENRDRIAVSDGSRDYSYDMLEAYSLRIAVSMCDKTAENEVAIYLPKGVEQIFAVIGTVLAGKTYLPLEYGIPAIRAVSCLMEANVLTVITDKQSMEIFQDTPIHALDIDELCHSNLDAGMELGMEQTTVALIFTSGSTGSPKAVQVPDAGLVNCIEATVDEFGISKDDTAIALTNIAHDMSMFDMFGIFSVGGRLVVPNESERKDALAWKRLIDQYGVTVWNSVPALLENLFDTLELTEADAHIGFRLVFVGGDRVFPALLGRLKHFAPNAKLISVGGPTETTLWNIWHRVTDEDARCGFVPYGKPIRNTVYSIRNENMMRLPIGIEGIMFCEGVGVSSGYRALPDETRKRFVHDADGTLLYDTGDVGCFLPNGSIKIMGRRDAQVKILGKRIELSEIENQIQGCAGVKQCAVCASDGKIVAFVAVTDNSITSEAVKKYCSERLPAYMIPSRIAVRSNLLLTANGKIDRKALLTQIIDEPQPVERGAEMSADAFTLKLYNTVCDVLKLDSLDMDENLYYLGMNSLNAILIINQLQLRYGIDIPVREFVNGSTLRDIIAVLPQSAEPVEEYVCSNDRLSPFPLTELQQAYVVGRDPRIPLGGRPSCGYGELRWRSFDIERFICVLQALAERHDALRCVVLADGMQQICEEIPRIEVPFTDLSAASDEEKRSWIMRTRSCYDELDIPLQELPKFRFSVTKLAEDEHIVHMYFDLLIADGWSIHLFLDELDKLYTDPNCALASAKVSFKDYCEYKQHLRSGARYKKDREFWLERIAHLPDAVTLPMLKDSTNIGKIITSQQECSLSMDEWAKLQVLAAKHGVTPFAILFTVFNHVILRWNRKQRLLICMPESDRPLFHPDVKNMMGECSSFYVFTAEHICTQSFAEAVKATQEQLWLLYEHRSFTGVEVLREIYRKKNEFGNALIPIVFSTILNYKSAQTENFEMVYDHTFTSQIMIDIDVQRIGERIKFNWNYVNGLLDPCMIATMAGLQMRLLKAALESAEFWNSPFSIELPKESRPDVPPPEAAEEGAHKPLNSYLADSFEKYAEKSCIIYRGKALSYSDVAALVGNAKRKFKERNLKKGDLIAIYCKKSLEQVIAAIAAAACGMVYVPLEYDLPPAALKNCMTSCKVRAAVLDREKIRYLDGMGIELFSDTEILAESKGADASIEELFDQTVTADDRFAVIHTSGSTGFPKAVSLLQKGIVNALLFSCRQFELCMDDIAIALTNIAHDMSVFDMFGMLMCGGAFVIPEHESAKDPAVWQRLIRDHRVTVWNSVPAMMEMMLETAHTGSFKTIRHIISGGDYLVPETALAIFAAFPNAALWNVGGPTETTLWNIVHRVTRTEAESGVIPYGRPIAGNSYYLLNEEFEEVPVGVTGMMYCAGIGVSEGYLNDDLMTRSKFIKIPRVGERCYCTGDLGKYDENGELVFMGRSDRQVKINGKRIELSGINAVLRKYSGVLNSAVRLGENGKSILAYYVSDEPLDEMEIKSFIQEYLPQYMIPTKLMRIDAIPLTANGKLDLSALPERAEKTDENLPVRGTEELSQTESTLVGFCRELLDDEGITLDSNFFLSGGNSLLALRLVRFVNESMGASLAMTDIFTGTSLRDWCRKIDEGYTG